MPGTLAGEFVRRRDQGATVRRVESAVATVGGDDEVGFGPRTVKRPRAFHGADDVVTALHDYPGDAADARGIAQQLVVGFEETFVDEVVRLNAREGEGELILLVVAGKGGIGQELEVAPSQPLQIFAAGESHGRVVAGEAAVVGGEQIDALRLRDVGEVRLPSVRIEDRSATLVEPVDFLHAEEEDAAEDGLGDPIGMSLGIG